MTLRQLTEMHEGKRQHDGIVCAHIKAAVIAAAGGKSRDIPALSPFKLDEDRPTLSPSQYFSMTR